MECSIAPSKVLLFGEHFVVAGKPALGLAVAKYAKVCVEEGEGRVFSSQIGLISEGSAHRRLFDALFESFRERYGISPRVNLYVDSEVPMSSGMGSSASVAVAAALSMLRHYGVEYTKEDAQRLAHEAEKAVHYKPSGVDTALATHGGLIYYKQGLLKRLSARLPQDAALLVVNTRVERITGAVVRDVLERYQRLGDAGALIYSAAEALVEHALRYIESGDLEKLGELMLVNHGLLWAMGASSRICDEVVYEMLEAGALGAKVSGAGRGGIVVGLYRAGDAERALAALSRKGFEAFVARPDYEGVRPYNVKEPLRA